MSSLCTHRYQVLLDTVGVAKKSRRKLMKATDWLLLSALTSFFAYVPFLDQAHNVTIHNKERSLRAGSQHEFTCEALGSRPAADITWWFDDQQIHPQVDNVQIVSRFFGPWNRVITGSRYESDGIWIGSNQVRDSSWKVNFFSLVPLKVGALLKQKLHF